MYMFGGDGGISNLTTELMKVIIRFNVNYFNNSKQGNFSTLDND